MKEAAEENTRILENKSKVGTLVKILKVNVAACKSIGNAFLSQIYTIFWDMLSLYGAANGFISEAVLSEGELWLLQTSSILTLITLLSLRPLCIGYSGNSAVTNGDRTNHTTHGSVHG
jgi:hypothetical protein